MLEWNDGPGSGTVKYCASFGSADGSDLLHICFDLRYEYYPFVVFGEKN